MQLLSLVWREDRLDLLLRLLMDRSDLRLLFFRQIKAAERVASTASARTTTAPGTAGTTGETRTPAALSPATDFARPRGALGIQARLGTTVEQGGTGALIAGCLRILRALRLRRRDCAKDDEDGCTK